MGQIFILDNLSTWDPKDDREAQSICERITPRLAHANAAVVLSAVRVLMKYMEMMGQDTDFVTNISKKLSPPLVTLLSSEPEVQYVALRNINLIIQKRPDILKHEMKVFFVKYNDPIYIELEISGSWSVKNGVINMEMTFNNKAMQAMQNFAIQLNKNSFGLVASQGLNIPMLNAGQTLDVSVPMSTTGPVQKMEPLTNVQVAIKNSVDIFYFACLAPIHVFFSEEGNMEKKTFLNTWKDIPAANEIQYTIENVECTSDGIQTKMAQNNAFTVAKRTLEGQDMIYQSMKLTNGIWGLMEIKLAPDNPNIILSFKSRVMEIAQPIFQVYDAILHN